MTVSRYSPASSVSITDKCIILDIDHTMAATQSGDKQAMDKAIPTTPEAHDLRRRVYAFNREHAGSANGDGESDFMWGVMRPGLKEFLIFCFSYFKAVIVWSAGTKEYVELVCESLFSDVDNPMAIFSRDSCVYDEEAEVYRKPIATLIKQNPRIAQYVNLKNTYIVDDTKYTFQPNPDNAIHIPRYLPESESNVSSFNAMRANDIALDQIRTWLSRPEVIQSEDIRTLNKKRIFDIPYSEVLTREKTLYFR